MKSFNTYLMDPRVFCYIAYDIKLDTLEFVMVSKDCDMTDEYHDSTFYKWIKDIGDIISEKVEYFGKYKRITIISSGATLTVDNDSSILKILNKKMYNDHYAKISTVCNYDLTAVNIEDNEKLDSEKTGTPSSESIDDLDRILVWNWELDQFNLDTYRADTLESKAPLNLTISYDGNIIALIKSSKFEKDNIFFSELVRR